MDENAKTRILALIEVVEVVLLVKDYSDDLKVALVKLEEAAVQVKRILETEDKPAFNTGDLECGYKIGVLCEHKDFPNTPKICDLGFCPLLKSL